ncbi:MAG: alpha/beta fold hydrolase [Proteobacteria bacterium]|nr:alpha/beta fold hydrolase [Pseudomonadota bacterium]
MKYILTILTMLAASPVSANCVVLIHGLARSSTSFVVMKTGLEGIGYDVVNVDYPSTESRIEDLALTVIPAALTLCKEDAQVHFVTHSMGGILVRYYMKHTENKPENLGHVVMLGPPNKGSPVVDKLVDMPGFDMVNGIAGHQLGTGPTSLPNTLGPVDFSLGVIAGNESVSPILSRLIKGDDDGKVSVESTKIAGMSDHIVLDVTHTFMMNSPSVFMQVAHFLREGHFKQ